MTCTGRFLGSEQSRESGGVVPLPDGTWYRFVSTDIADTSAAVLLVNRDRRTTQTVATYYWPKVPTLDIRLQQGAIVGIQPFGNRASVVVSSPTSNLVLVEPLQTPGAIRYRLVTPNGRVVVERRLDLPLQPLTDSIYDAAIASWQERGGPEHRSLPRAVLTKAIHRPQYLSTVRGRVAASDGTIWLQAGPESSGVTTWVLLSSQGRLAGQVTGPPRLRLLAATNRAILGAITNEDGVVALVHYRLGS